jgi:hypothetical protein
MLGSVKRNVSDPQVVADAGLNKWNYLAGQVYNRSGRRSLMLAHLSTAR